MCSNADSLKSTQFCEFSLPIKADNSSGEENRADLGELAGDMPHLFDDQSLDLLHLFGGKTLVVAWFRQNPSLGMR